MTGDERRRQVGIAVTATVSVTVSVAIPDDCGREPGT
jgi:hypothetical protein